MIDQNVTAPSHHESMLATLIAEGMLTIPVAIVAAKAAKAKLARVASKTVSPANARRGKATR